MADKTVHTGTFQSFASAIDDAALRFEQEWDRDPGSPPTLETFIPVESAARDRAALRLAQIDIERRAAAGSDPRAEDYLERFPNLRADPEDVFALVLTEAEARIRHGKRVDPDEYRRRFPEVVDRLIGRLLHRSLPQVPGYEILGELGRGGMGVVYKARQTKLNRLVALKVVTVPDRQSIRRFLVEAEAVAAVRHPHVIQVFDSGEYADLPYLAMEYLEGGSLRDLLRRTPVLTPAEAATLVAAVADGVHAVHEAGIVHRDLKPANVLLGKDEGGRMKDESKANTESSSSVILPPSSLLPKVTDFGLALRGGVELTQTQGKFLGTPAYAPPEQAAGLREFIGPTADVWALGVILYECLTGRRPFEGDNPLSVLNAVQKQPVPPPRSLNRAIPRDLELICLKCLEKEPRERYASAAALSDDLRRYLDGKPVAARPVGKLTQAAKWVRRNPVPTALIAAVLLGSVGTAGAALIARENARAAAASESSRVSAERDAAEAARRQLAAELAEAAEKERRGRAESAAAIAEALQANDLQRVVDVVAAAERQGLRVPPERRLAAAAALGALAKTAQAREKLEAIYASPDLTPPMRARVELMLADFLFGIDDDRARSLIRSARESGLLSPADLAYADGVDAGSMRVATEHLQDAVRHDPTHFPARRLLGMWLFVSGRLDEAIEVGEVSRLLSRNHPEILWPLFFSYGFKGKSARTREMLELLRPHMTPEMEKQFEGIAKYLPAINAQFRASITGDPEPIGELYKELAADGGASSVMSPLRATNIITGTLFGRMPPMFRDSLDDYLELTFATATPGRDYVAELAGDERKLARLKRNMERRPEGFMIFVYSIALTTRAFSYHNKFGNATPHMNRFREMSLVAAEAYRWAAESPGLIDVRSIALEGAALHYGLAARPIWIREQDADLGTYRKAVEMVKRRLAMAEPVDPARLEVFTRMCRNAGDLTTARRVLDEWQQRQPDNPLALQRRAEVEFKGEAFGPALRAAREALAKEPGNARMREIEAECLSKLRRDPDVPPEEAPPPRPINR